MSIHWYGRLFALIANARNAISKAAKQSIPGRKLKTKEKLLDVQLDLCQYVSNIEFMVIML